MEKAKKTELEVGTPTGTLKGDNVFAFLRRYYLKNMNEELSGLPNVETILLRKEVLISKEAPLKSGMFLTIEIEETTNVTSKVVTTKCNFIVKDYDLISYKLELKSILNSI